MKLFVRRALAAATLSIAVAGCQTIGDLSGTRPSAETAPEASIEPLPPSVPDLVAAVTPPAASNSINGMDSERLIALWGEPSLKRRDIGSELWTYGKPKAKCSILIYVYPSKDGRMVIARGEATPGGADDNVVAACARANDLPSVKPVS